MKKEQRIKKTEEIESIIKERKVVAGECFVVYKKENHLSLVPRLAVSVPKKFGIAVKRNQAKRRIRSIFKELPIKNNHDVFVVIKQNASNISFDEMKNELRDLLQKARLLEEK